MFFSKISSRKKISPQCSFEKYLILASITDIFTDSKERKKRENVEKKHKKRSVFIREVYKGKYFVLNHISCAVKKSLLIDVGSRLVCASLCVVRKGEKRVIQEFFVL